MTFISLKGNRESLNQNSESFKSKIIEYMTQRGFFLINDSANDGIFTDLIFKRPLIEGDKETRAESKFTELSLKDKDFLKGLGVYFNMFNIKKFSLFIFVKKCKNPSQWKEVFDDAKMNSEEIDKLRGSILSALDGVEKKTFEKYNLSEFLAFASEITLIQGDYPSLLQSIDEMKKTEKFNVNKSLLEEKYKIIQRPENITSNLLKINKLPEFIWTADLKKVFTQEEMHNMALDKQIFLNKRAIYSLRNPQEDKELINYITNIKRIKMTEWIIEESRKITILKVLIKYHIINKARKMGLAHDPLTEIVYFMYRGPGYSKKFKGRRLFNPYHDKKSKDLRFVKHDGISIFIKFYSGFYYISFAQRLIFTEDGKKNVIRGGSASALHHKFTQRFSYNNVELSKLLYWISIFQFKDQVLLITDNFSISGPLCINSTITFDGGEKFDSNIVEYLEGDNEDEL